MRSLHLTKGWLVSELRIGVAVLAIGMPLFVPFGLSRSIEFQANVLIAAGLLAWVGLLISKSKVRWNSLMILLTLYVLSCIVATLLHASLHSIWGSPLIRLGGPGLIACVGAGLFLRGVPAAKLAWWIYIVTVILAVTAIPYSRHFAHVTSRPGGVFYQPDFLAVWLACGLLIGWMLLAHAKAKLKILLAVAQVVLLIVLLLTQTRAVIALAAVLSIIYLLQQNWKSPHRRNILLAYIVAIVLIVGAVRVMTPTSRLGNTQYAEDSISYRLHLQSYGVRAFFKQPLQGYGPGRLDEALACPTLHDASLQKTCHEHHYFDSSHNVFLDRFMALGVIGGVAFAAVVVALLWRGMLVKTDELIFAYCALLIALYYFTNVTSIAIELLFWVCLCRAWPGAARKSGRRSKAVAA